MIEVTDLTVRYGEQQQRTALEDVSFTVGRGQFVLLSGPSGCGKSTLAHSLNGLIPHASSARMTGRVVVDGMETAAHSLPELAAHVGLVFQNPATQLFNATVEEEVAFAPRNLGLPADGEQQRVAIASVLALRPQVLVLDEPTSNLDWRGVEQVMSTLARLHRQQKLTILVIEHRLHAVVPLADRVLLMRGGRFVADGRPEDVFAVPPTSPPRVGGKEGGLIALRRGSGQALGLRYPWRFEELQRTGRIQRTSEGEASPTLRRSSPRAKPRGSGQATQLPNHPTIPSSHPLVAIQGLEAGYGRRTVLQGLDLALYPGEFAALVGDNGAGKSTLAKVLAGLLRPRRGRITWDEELRRLPLGRRVGFLFQNPLDQLVCDTVEEEIAFGPRNLRLPVRERVETTLAVAGLTALRHRRSAALSVGEQQRTALAAALSTDPRLLILDEPTMGQDWAHLSHLMESLTQLNHNGQAILLITHDDKLVCRYAGRIILLAEGRIVADGSPRQGIRGTRNYTA
jgi:energy-coupling factor transport system ATP-binding protein